MNWEDVIRDWDQYNPLNVVSKVAALPGMFAAKALEATGASNLVNPWWWVSRPQQMVFNAAQEGSKAFEEALSNRNNTQGHVPVLSEALSGLASMPSFYKGAAKALNPWGNDVKGADLVDGLTQNREWNEPIGNTLDILADPLGLSGGKAAGTLYRTASNINQMEKVAPEAARKIDDLFGMKKFLTDVPHVEVNAPVIFRDTNMFNPNEIAMATRPALAEKYADFGDKLRGTSFGDTGLAYIKKQPEEQKTLAHEFTHWALNPWMRNKDIISSLKPMGSRFDRVLERNPGVAADTYGSLSPAMKGNEFLARIAGDRMGTDMVPDILKRFYDKAVTLADKPEYLSSAPEMALNWLLPGGLVSYKQNR